MTSRYKLRLQLEPGDASRYIRRHTSRLISTTTVAIISVAASSTSKCPLSLAWLMVLPNPGASTTCPWK